MPSDIRTISLQSFFTILLLSVRGKDSKSTIMCIRVDCIFVHSWVLVLVLSDQFFHLSSAAQETIDVAVCIQLKPQNDCYLQLHVHCRLHSQVLSLLYVDANAVCHIRRWWWIVYNGKPINVAFCVIQWILQIWQECILLLLLLLDSSTSSTCTRSANLNSKFQNERHTITLYYYYYLPKSRNCKWNVSKLTMIFALKFNASVASAQCTQSTLICQRLYDDRFREMY